jgi:general secretion pathway protein I
VTHSSRAKGFTLLEVLVALAIVAMGMAALMAALSSAADSSIYLRDKTFAEWVALNRIEEVRLALQRPSKGKSDGDVDFAGIKWKWEQEILETEVKGIMRIDVRVKPASIQGDSNWYTTMTGLTGDALATPSGVIDFYGRPSGQPGGGGGPGPDNTPRPRDSPLPGGTPNPPGDTGGQNPPADQPPPAQPPAR